MTQRELAKAIASQFFIPSRESQKLIQFVLLKVTAELVAGNRVYIRGFGSFKKVRHKSKKIRHPKTGKIITVPERVTVDFNPSHFLLIKL